MEPRIKQVREILDELARAELLDNDSKEIVYDRELEKAKNLDRDGIIEVVTKAIGKSAKRRRFAPFIFSELYDIPGIEDIFLGLLGTADDTGRSAIIQTIGIRKLRNLVGALNAHFYRESDEFCREMILRALGKIADESSLSLFVELMRENDHKYEWQIICASHSFVRSEFREYLLMVYNSTTKTAHKVMAAWGLAKLGENGPYDYLVKMLDDPEIKTENSYDPGHSMRAAQAIADINGWNFKWGKNSVEQIKSRIIGP